MNATATIYARKSTEQNGIADGEAAATAVSRLFSSDAKGATQLATDTDTAGAH